ncbi:MAG: hypothetical protein K8S25_18420 [Alphaproteobacteria bacterium]|nr:hypothetical protein [Alphaproteobacteria bacterium]
MRLTFATALSLVLALGLAAGGHAAEPKKPKPVDIKKEILEKCGSIPYGPTIVMDAKTATKEEMETAKTDVVAFITQADVYQECLDKLAKTLAERLSDNDKRLLVAAIERSQQEKEALGNDYNKLVDAYNKLHK